MDLVRGFVGRADGCNESPQPEKAQARGEEREARDCGEDAAALAKRIQGEGIILRPLGPWGAPTALRVTVGTPPQNRRFMAALKHAMERVAARS